MDVDVDDDDDSWLQAQHVKRFGLHNLLGDPSHLV